MKLVAELDGDHICIHREDFTNLMESPCVFVKLTDSEVLYIQALLGQPTQAKEIIDAG